MDPGEVLGVNQDAGDEEIRTAYVRKVQEHPPDRSPEEFERIRDPERKVIGGMSREEVLRRFEEWLDGALAAEQPPRGVEAEILAGMAGESEDRAGALWA